MKLEGIEQQEVPAPNVAKTAASLDLNLLTSCKRELAEVLTTEEQSLEFKEGRKKVYFDRLKSWLLNEMVKLNNSSIGEEVLVEKLQEAAQNFILQFFELDELTSSEEKKALQYLGFLMSSLERHAQFTGHKPGEGLASIKGATELMLYLGRKTGHPPRDSLYTFCLWNTGPEVITFSGDPQEKLFIDIVIRSTAELKTGADLARKIKFSLDQGDLEVLKEISNCLDRAREQFVRFLKSNESGMPNLTAAFFTGVLRQYNCKWMIEDTEWGGPTAANCAPYISLDYLIGTADLDYKDHTISRLRYMTDEDQQILLEDMEKPSISRRILMRLGFEPDSFLDADEDFVASIFTGSEPALLDCIKVFNEIVDKFSLLSGLHFGLIRKFLIRPITSEKQEISEPEKTMVVDNKKGTSGMTFEDVMRIREMRRSNLILKKIKASSAPYSK